MSIFIDNAISGWIRKAEQTGELKDNPYKGKSIDLEDYFNTPAEHRMGMKILKDANCLPPAIQLMKEIEVKKEQFQQEANEHSKEALRKEIISLELKRDLLLESQ
ncbi:DUF1992 domain-containing protein [Vibrio mediterranei]|uniref:DnaJ family domain-containing protein n=1 Tax=Vibrio mediterranei TaxID=689 RepID=UPI00148D51C2|nr:DUF1992 domain-containing protein [Vibrio mediterranei]MCG9626525.1 DUF1992 domain-containing protein [Vibrio mediterranei]NOI26395.1 DUF1992 domain-containing protein [Vibrio mediterranei]